ncbi:MAG: ABC transporter substrate-binding protein [Chloroflexi bacterium]|nr:ABC transporter substrate-binding protein [Chloroflexota bacterium]
MVLSGCSPGGPRAISASSVDSSQERPAATISGPAPTATPRPQLSSVTVIVPGSIGSFNPLVSHGATARALEGLLLPRLVRLSSRGEILPDLASSWSAPSPDTLELHLSCGTTWSDGKLITSADAVATIRAILNPAVDPGSSQLRSALAGVTVSAPDPCTLVVRSQHPVDAKLLALLSVPLLPQAVLEGVHDFGGLTSLSFDVQPVTAGLYTVQASSVLSTELQRREVTGLAPQRVTLCFGGQRCGPPNPDGAVRLMQSGGNPRASNGGERLHIPLARPVMIFLNLHQGFVGDPAVRRALSLALQRRKLVEHVLHGEAEPLLSPLVPWFWAFDPTDEVPDGAPAQAEAVLAADGWERSPQGWSRGGVRLTMTLLTTADRLRVAQAVAVFWQKIGIPTRVEVAGLDGLARDFLATGHYQAALLGIDHYGTMPDLAPLWSSTGALNVTGIHDALLDAAITGSLSLDTAEARQGYESFQRRFNDVLPALPLYVPTATVDVRGVDLNVTALRSPEALIDTIGSWRRASP